MLVAQRCVLRACADAQRGAHNAALSALCIYLVPLQGLQGLLQCPPICSPDGLPDSRLITRFPAIRRAVQPWLVLRARNTMVGEGGILECNYFFSPTFNGTVLP